MSIYVPAALTAELEHEIRQHTTASVSGAGEIANLIAWVAISAATEALDQSKSYATGLSSGVRSDLTNSLNYASAYLSDDIALVREYITDTLLPALEGLTGGAGGVNDSIAQNIVDAYDAISESQEIAGDNTRDAIQAAEDWIVESVTTASQFVNEGVMAAVAMVGDTVIEITKGIDSFVQSALDVLIPAEMRAMFQTVGDILAGDPVRMLFDYGGKVFKEQLGDVLTIDDEELQKWIKTGSDYMQRIAMKPLEPEGGL